MSEKKFNRYTVTAALPYANGPVHIGHLAGVYVPADIYVRYLRLKGEDVIFVCGSDEHGVPITIRASKEGVSPQQVVDKYHEIIKDSFSDFGISFDIYSRTSAPVHHETASDFFKILNEKEVFEEYVSEQYYDEQNNQFLADRYIIGTCPKCGFENAYGDQCESCGTSLSPSDLINPKSTLSGAKPILKDTKHWYLPLNKFEGWLRDWILDGHKEWKSNVYGQCKSWIEQGLQPRAVTRDLEWGVPVPAKGAEGKVLYVWFDAPIGYISATKDWSEKTGNDWEPYWKSNDTKLVHFIGKDNIVFHCIIFPAMLKSHGEFILPENVPANEFLNLESNKISTSRNWAVWLHEYLQEFPGKEDVLRYTLCSNAPETKDNDFTWKDFQAKNNNELLAILGNFINRAVVLTHKYYEGSVPEKGELFDIDTDLIQNLKDVPTRIGQSIELYRFREALGELMDLARLGNKYLADTEPWKLIKTNPERVKTIMNLSLQISANLAILIEPFLPFTAQKLNKMLNVGDLKWKDTGRIDILVKGHRIEEATLLFTRIEDEEVEAQVNKLNDTKKANELASKPVTPSKAEIVYDDFIKMDIRVATILEAERVKKSKKLLKLSVDTGLDKRTVVSGIGEYYDPETIIGRQVTILVNLAPRQIMGIESKGMILMAEDKDGSLSFISPDRIIANGGTIS
jgi:methionyl-tRNA synthetase